MPRLADVLAWVATLANIVGVDLDEALDRYARGCPKCGGHPLPLLTVPCRPRPDAPRAGQRGPESTS